MYQFYIYVVFRVWWPFFVVLFYILAPVPTIITRCYANDIENNSNSYLELAIFITTGFVISSFALPIVLARSPVNDPVVHLYAYFIFYYIVILYQINNSLIQKIIYISIMDFQIQWGACYLTLAGNIIMYLTLVGFFVTFDQDELEYNTC